MIVRLARKILGLKGEPEIIDAVHYNSKQNIDALHSNDKHFRKILTRAQKPVETFYELLKEKELLSGDRRIIDVGCGSANLLGLISSGFPSASLTGADFSESKISNCRILYPQIDFEVRDIYNQLKSSYDLILCTEVLEHLLYPDRALKMLLDGINEHGSIFITVPNGRLDSFSGHINFWSPESWKVFLEENITEGCTLETGLIFNDKAMYAIITRP